MAMDLTDVDVHTLIKNSTHISKYKDEDGKLIKAIGHCKEGEKVGTWLFFRSKKLIGISNFKKGIEHGQTISYIDGEIATIVNYKNGKEHGKMEEYYKGLKVIEREYKDGTKVSTKRITEKAFRKRFPDLTEDDI